MEKALFLAAFFFAYTVQVITGFAGNIFAMPVGTTLLGLESTVSILNAMGFFACGLLTALNIKSVNWRELGKILGAMIVFMVLGIWLDTLVPLHILLKIYGVIIVIIGIKNLAVPQQKFMPEWALWIILALAGLIQGMFVSGGALLVIYAVQKLRDQQQFRITLSAVWTVLNLIYAGIAFQQGHFTGDVVQIIVFCVPLAVSGQQAAEEDQPGKVPQTHVRAVVVRRRHLAGYVVAFGGARRCCLGYNDPRCNRGKGTTMAQEYARIFAALDGASTQEAVAQRAVTLAADNHAKLMFGHVIDSVPYEASGVDFEALCAEGKKRIEADLADVLAAARQNPDIPSVEVSVHAGRIADTLEHELIEPFEHQVRVRGQRVHVPHPQPPLRRAGGEAVGNEAE